jgi:GntR family transcriptional regulator, transcriptional repressor for pyruvate dehydrogenase complex
MARPRKLCGTTTDNFHFYQQTEQEEEGRCAGVIKKIVRDGVTDQVYNQLKENVVDGVWQPGEKIPSENQLVLLFGVSRASVRMAIQKMIALGLLESRVGAGTYVRSSGPGPYINELVSLRLKARDQIEIMEFRKALETEALKLAVERATDEDIAELEAIHHRARKAHKKKDVETYFKEDIQFHSQIFKMSKNSIFAAAMQTLEDVLFPHFYTTAKVFFRTFRVPSDKEDKHTVILEALKKRDVRTCVRAYTTLAQELIAMYRELQQKDADT